MKPCEVEDIHLIDNVDFSTKLHISSTLSLIRPATTVMALQFTVVLIVLAYIIYRFMVFPVFLSPLAKIPTAHWSCSISPLWILWKRLAGQQNVTVLAAHRKHGDVVRLGPTELSVNCVEDGYKTIYAGNFGKDDYYRFFDNFGYAPFICWNSNADKGQDEMHVHHLGSRPARRHETIHRTTLLEDKRTTITGDFGTAQNHTL